MKLSSQGPSEPWVVPLVMAYRGGHWSRTETPLVPPGVSNGKFEQLVSVSCVSETFCAAVGGIQFRSQPRPGVGLLSPRPSQAMVAIFNGASWSFQLLPGSGHLRSVSCATTTLCMAIGTGSFAAGTSTTKGARSSKREATAYVYNGRTWAFSKMPSSLVEAHLRSVSRVSAVFCEAVGRTTSGFQLSAASASNQVAPDKAVIENYNGVRWAAQESAGRLVASELEGV